VTADGEDLEDLDARVRRNDPERWLASRFIADARARADVIALYAFDDELSRIPQVTTEPLMGEVRLTWWREALDEIFEGRPVRRHPVALALAGVIGRHKLPRETLDAMLEPRFDDPASRQAGPLMRLAVYVLCGQWALVGCAAEAWVENDPDELHEANLNLKDLPAKGFPAVAYATLARTRREASSLEKRLRLIWAVMRGRL
jgi:phytoene synthase